MKKALIDYIKRGKNDEIYTPDEAIKPLLKYLNKNLIVWECTDYGKSRITQVLKENGFKVVSTHKKDFDFLENNPDFDFDIIIITNPPYSLKNEFLKKCYEYKKPFCLLLPITSLEGIERGKLYRENGIQILVFDKRINFLNNKKSNWFNTSWFCHNVLSKDLIFEEYKEDKKI